MDARARLLAFYLPQFHPIPENDAWWGEGFTEWVNVLKAKPLFPGHYQPHLPANLGAYDLRLPEVREAQADLAREHGIYGFCYYHYWFNGKILLGLPFDEVLASGQPDFPFCLCWANENWTRTWDGLDQHVLISQTYTLEDDREHIRWLGRAFRHPNYIRIEGKPLFLVYKVSKIPDPLRTTSLWREEARRIGVGELYLCTVESMLQDRVKPTANGFDAAVEFQPDWANLGPADPRDDDNYVYDYAFLVERMLRKRPPSYKRFPCVTPGWDNTPRRRDHAFIFKDSTPELYERWLGSVLDRSISPDSEENLVFINAWNEWGEGCHLEPCQRWGPAYFEATRRAVQTAQNRSAAVASTPAAPRKTAPRVSVCIPTYNGAEYIREAVASVLDQTRDDFELLIVDDCSTDTTEAVVRSIDDPRIKHFKNSERLGLVGNWNRCFDLSSGEYVCIFHQDDIMVPRNIHEKVRTLDENPAVGLVHSNVHQIDAKGDLISEWWYFQPQPKDAGIHLGSEFFRTLMSGPNIVCCPSAVVRRECFQKLGGFDPRLPFTADWEMWLRIALHYNVAYLNEPLVKYRRHNGNETLNFTGAKELQAYYQARMLILEKYPERIPQASILKAKVTREHVDLSLERALGLFRDGQYEEAERYLIFASEVHRSTSQCGPAEPVSRPAGRAAERHIVDDISGEELAEQIPIRKIVKALAFKIAGKPGFRWLHRYRPLGKWVAGE